MAALLRHLSVRQWRGGRGAQTNLLMSGTHLASSAYADATREALAMHIIDLAKTGEHDVIRLRDDAVGFVLDALRRKQA